MPDTRSGSIEVLHLSKQFSQRETGLTLDVLNDGIEKTRKQAREKYELMKERIGLGR